MAIQFRVSVTPGLITVSIPEIGYSTGGGNQVVYDSASSVLLHICGRGEQVPERYLQLMRDPARKVVIRSVFVGNSDEIGPEVAFLRMATSAMHQELKGKIPVRHFFMKLFDQFDYELALPEDVSFATCKKIGDAINANFRVRKLTINRQDLTIPRWRRDLEYWARRFFVDVLSFVMIFVFSWQGDLDGFGALSCSVWLFKDASDHPFRPAWLDGQSLAAFGLGAWNGMNG